ncbi:hypothetical protein SRB521_03199 [Intestinimonas butyriciproducens]|nr:hypothetical protein SRB521_03199 [Intestinimonas butyriciproducens]
MKQKNIINHILLMIVLTWELNFVIRINFKSKKWGFSFWDILHITISLHFPF